ncbi:putative Ig domain-containing protein [Salegentibacter sp. JZCK2]|uniref:malectin domain-containing carbohydrate-binding protein n=1 Tax=Salegentibacter tibetensis TaxID=2873600 RepID=UPI001CCDC4E8|nr:malectin domain-containing carbohydrate-binding protein [Salegentibacter tibetensis]MBZ9728631.1 putative Ig domain-containing protein [Salegentibacter tibetensis]
MKTFYSNSVLLVTIFWSLLFSVTISPGVFAQSFSQNNINFNGKGSVNNVTSMSFGPDGRLYVTEYVGIIKVFTLERNGPGDYIVTHMEELKEIQAIQDHNDDGSLYSSTMRETIGIVVVGTATQPIVYVSSSDFRIGGGGGGGSGDVNLDTNSGIITRFSWNGTSWDVVDIVRGLPRSEENHATNGLDFATVNGEDYLIVAQGGNTNAGAPSTNFAYLTEYALSAAVLSVNLTQLEAMPILDDNGRKYIYDLPTLDDPTRSNVNGITDPDDPNYDGIDINDPFGGNDGLNQAIIVPGGPVQIFSPGYRNTYDLVVTENGAVYVTDNGANGGWGGFPVNEGGGDANNDYDPNEPGSTTATADGEIVNNKDHLTMVTPDIQNYQFGSFYGGHPTPVRANPFGAGLYTSPAATGTEGAIFRTQIYDPDGSRPGSTTDPSVGLPANWPPVQVANPVEGDYRGPGDPNPDGPEDQLVTIWGTNTNGIAEYTASNFEGAMKGNLIAGVNTGELRRVELNPDGTLLQLTPSFASGLGGNALGVACNGDNDPFPGTIWVGTLDGGLIVLEPQDFVTCVGPDDPEYDPLADYDYDGYTNQDEVDNGTDPCNGGSQPNDFDKAAGAPLISDLNDPDDDSDGIPDAEDPFQLGDPLTTGSDAFLLPVVNELFSSNPDLKGYMGLGMTGLMNNADPNPNWLNWLDRRDDPNDPNPNDILGGAIGAMTMQMTSGTALGISNNQEKGFQYGVQVDQSTGVFTVTGGLFNFDAPLQLYGHPDAPNGELGIFIGTGFQDNYIKYVLTKNGLTIQQELNDVPLQPLQVAIPIEGRPQSGAALFFVIDPASGNIDFEYAFDTGPRILAGSMIAQGAILEAIQMAGKDLAVGLIGTSNASGVEIEGTWDYLNVTGKKPYIVKFIEDIEAYVGTTGTEIDLHQYFGDDEGVENLSYSIIENIDPSIGASISGSILSLVYPSSAAQTQITIRATDTHANYIDQNFTVTVLDQMSVLYRVNAGGVATAAIDGELDWGGDTSGANSPYLSVAGSNSTASFGMTGYTSEVDQNTTPVSIFDTERYDGNSGAPNLTYTFPVSEPGNYEVRLYMGNGYSGTSEPGTRIFDVAIEGVIYSGLNDLDLSGTFGHQIGAVVTQTVEVIDGAIDIVFLHGSIENPLVNGIEILGSAAIDTPIEVASIADQTNFENDILDGSLVVSASGGDGNLSYAMSGQPAGVTIEPTNGQIGGVLDAGSAVGSPYTVIVTVDDSDAETSDAVTTSFTWTVYSGDPIVVQELPDLERIIVAANEDINLNTYFDDNNGVENLVYTVTGNTDPAISAVISANILTLSYPDSPAVSEITIRATDADANFVEQSFMVSLSEAVLVLYRVNSGGSAIAAIDGELDWGGDTSGANSPYLSVAGSNNTASFGMTGYTSEVDQNTTPVSIFDTERYDDKSGAPNMTYTFPVSEPGNYEVRLYMGNGYSGTSEPGTRIFDVAIEGVIYSGLNDLDLSGTFGHQIGAVVTQTVEVIDGAIDIVFLHGSIENPLVNGIEILGSAAIDTPIEVASIADQTNYESDVLDGSLVVSASGGDGSLVYSMTGAPAGVSIDPATGVISGTIDAGASLNSPYAVTVSVDDSDEDTTDAVSTGFTWTILSGDPVITAVLPDLERFTSDPDDIIDLNLHFDDNDGVENLVYTVKGNTDPAISAVISANLLTLSYPNSPAIAEITIRATDTHSNFVEQSFTVTVSEETSQTPIEVAPIADQTNYEHDILDGSLMVSATGGDGALVYSMTGAPAGVGIDPATGVISGTIDAGASLNSPYAVTVTVDDSDEDTTDAVSTGFTWTILSGDPVITAVLPDLERFTGDLDENIDLNLHFDDNDGVENLVYTVTGNTDPSIGAVITGNWLTLSYPADPAIADITIRATDAYDNFVEQIFTVNVIEVAYQGCTAEFWAGTSNWCSTYKPTDSFFTVFGITNKRGLGGKTGTLTLQEALQSRGSGYNKLAKQGTAALLNACSISVNYQYPEAQIKAEVQDAFNNTSYNNSYANQLSRVYETANNAGCPSEEISLMASKSYETIDKEAEPSLYEEEPAVEESISIKLYPNPANAEVYFQASHSSVKINAVALYDYNGRYIRIFTTGQDLTYEGKERYMFNISGMPNGVYILKVSTESSRVFTFRFIKKD